MPRNAHAIRALVLGRKGGDVLQALSREQIEQIIRIAEVGNTPSGPGGLHGPGAREQYVNPNRNRLRDAIAALDRPARNELYALGHVGRACLERAWDTTYDA